MIRPGALLIGAALGLGVAACSSNPGATVPPGCRTTGPRMEVRLSARTPATVVRIPPGGCVEVTVPRSPFRDTSTEPPSVHPPGRLRLDSDTLQADGTRTVFYTAGAPGTAIIATTVDIHTGVEVPEWVAVVEIR